MRGINNDQNINRVCTKMSEDFHDENNAKLSKPVKSLAYFNISTAQEEVSDEEIDINDHMYASNTENDGVKEFGSPDLSCQTAESEVKYLKEWLTLHTDLVQQQNDDIIDKDKEIYLLRKENEMLKERINCIEKGTPSQTEKALLNHKVREDIQEITLEDMTQGPCEEDTKENIEIIGGQYCNNDSCSIEVINYQENHVDLSDNESQIESVPGNDGSYVVDGSEVELKSEEYILNDISDTYKSESDIVNCNSLITDYNFTINNVSESDPMKNIKMSIRRKRVCSNSSALSQSESPVIEEKQTYRRFKKKRRRSAKDTQTLTSSEPYVTQAHEVNFGIVGADPEIPESTATTTLEVPRWRHKIYASCYTMEGTENLDDEVYNKRHMRLENDERRRKRWDVQRIREQRVIEKLKQRQERVGSGSKGEETEPLVSLWPKLEDVKYLEVTDELPVSAFGNTVPKTTPSEFNLPWLSNPALLTKKPHSRRSTVRRKGSKR